MLPNGKPQTIKVKFFGQQFGEYIIPSGQKNGYFSTNQGCPVLPCASINPASPPNGYLEGIFGVNSHFYWVPDCNLLSIYGGQNINSYDFYFLISAQDDYCPVPKMNTQVMKITVKDNPLLPTIDSLTIFYNYSLLSAELNWKPISNPNSQFISYNETVVKL